MQKFEINPTALPQNPKERDLAIKLYALQTLEQQSFMNQFHRHFHPFNPHTHRTAMALSLTYEPPEALQPITSPHALKKRDRS
jgi:hypothetical protein